MEICDLNERVDHLADPFRTIQIHPTRRCNLTCLHCYSSSAPNLRDMVNLDALKRFLVIAYKHGFNNIAVSGGEPFLYNELEELLKFSKSLGYQNTMASNGMLLQSERNQRILEYVDLIAISVDGQAELHDQIRGQKGAFEKMMEGVNILNSLKKPFGLIHTVTPQSWESLLWLGEFAYENGAKLLQLHPLEMSGRALEKFSDLPIDDTLAHQTFILANYLQSKYSEKMVIQLDLLHRDYLEEFPQVVNSFDRKCAEKGRISDLLDTIIVEETGRILPISYGFAPKFGIGNIHNFEDSTFDQFIDKKVPMLKTLFNQTLNTIFSNKEIDIVNWNELLANASNVESRRIDLSAI
jgi:Fe-coproporphyrin III synthase